MTDAKLAALIEEYHALVREQERINKARRACREQMRGLTFPQAKILARAHFTAAPNTKALSGYHPSQVLKEGFAPNGITKRTWCAINFRGFPAAVTA